MKAGAHNTSEYRINASGVQSDTHDVFSNLVKEFSITLPWPYLCSGHTWIHSLAGAIFLEVPYPCFHAQYPGNQPSGLEIVRKHVDSKLNGVCTLFLVPCSCVHLYLPSLHIGHHFIIMQLRLAMLALLVTLSTEDVRRCNSNQFLATLLNHFICIYYGT